MSSKMEVYAHTPSRAADSYELLGITQHKHGDFTSALASTKRALDIRLKVFGEVDPKTADSYYLLGIIQHSLGNYISAFESDKRALDTRLKLFGEDHSNTADSYYSLGVTQHSLGDFISARESSKRALDIRLRLFGQEHTGTADCYYSLGATQNALGDLISARESYQRALDIKLKLLVKGNSDYSYQTEKVTRHSLEGTTSAVQPKRHMSDIRMKFFGEEHSNSKIANTYHSLGIAQYASGDYHSALESITRALQIRRRLFGERHSKTADSYHALGATQHALGDYVSALESSKLALEIRLDLFGVEHSKTADSYDSLGITQQEQGDFHSALQSNKRALDIRLKVFGKENSKTTDSYFSVGVTQHSLRFFRLALDSHEQALHARLKLFGEEHPKTADSYYALAITQYALGDISAYESSKRALDILLKLFGDPTAGSHYTLEVTQQKQFIDSLKELVHDTRQKVLLITAKDRSETADNEHGKSRYTSYIAKETPENELGEVFTMVTPPENNDNVEAFGNVIYEGGVVVVKEVQVICPHGAIPEHVNHLTIKITLEKPSTHCDMIVKNGLENDVMFIAPVVNLQPNGQVFKKSVSVTTRLAIDRQASPSDVLILHGSQTRDGKIFWQDITHKSKIDLEKKELKVEIEGFSLIAALLRLTSILTKNIITRFNLIGFHYTLSVLFKDNHPQAPFSELALVFMSHDVYHEKCYSEHPSSVLVQLKGNGFEELCSIDKTESSRVYNNEILKVSVRLGQDYKLTEEQSESTDLIVESSTWWSTGHVVKLSLKSIDDVRVLCGRIGVEGKYGHVLEETFCELDRCGYVKRLLSVEGSILNLKPIAKKLDVPKEAIDETIKTWKNDEEQLKTILQHWSKEQEDSCKEDPAVLKNCLRGLNQEACEVNERGKMHINHLRELAFEIQGLNREDPHLMEYFTNEIRTLCDSILKDCCIEMDADVSIENYPRFLSFHQRVTVDVAMKLEKICSSSTRSINEDFFSILPFLIQAIKEIFRKESPLIVQNGLKGLPKEIVNQHESKVRDAFLNQDILRLVYEVCGILENLCLHNCENQSTEVIQNWSETLGIWNMSEFLKGFFQSSQDSKFHKRLQLFSRSLRRILADIRDVKEIEMRYFYNVSLTLIKFATFDPSKLVRFRITDSTNSPVTFYSEALKYDRPHDTFSQQFEIRKESEDELRLGAIAQVHLDGRLRKVGAFESVITLLPSGEEELARCPIATLPVTVKKERKDSGNLRVVLSSTHKKNISEALFVLKRDLGDGILDREQAEITESCLKVCCFVECVGVFRLRLLYKWRAEAISVDSKDFVAIAESSAAGDYTGASDASGPFGAELAALSIASRSGDNNGNFVMDPSAVEMIQRHASQQCGRLELHLHQTFQKGHVCVTGENTRLHMQMPDTAQSFLQEGLCPPS